MRDDAVSENIGVILMIGIAAVLGVALYSWISSSADTTGAQSRTAALTSANAVQSNGTAAWKNYTVTSATGDLDWPDVTLRLAGTTLQCSAAEGSADTYRIWSGGSVLACDGTGAPAKRILAGDIVEIYDDGGGLSGKTLQLLDGEANRIIVQVSIL